jgi:hypothetical protein
MLAAGDAYAAAGEGQKKGQSRVLGSLVAMPQKAFIRAEEHENEPGVYTIMMDLTYGDGSVATLDTSIIYDANYKRFHDGEWSGIAGVGYNFNMGDGSSMYAYTTSHPFQRELGYMKLYDDLLLQTSDMVNITTQRIKFEYAGKEWMLQLWKGRYFITSAGEVGIYHKPLSRLVDFYDAAPDEDRIGMSFKLTAHDDAGDIVLVDRPMMNHWWMTGFALQKKIYLSDRLTLETTIQPKDADMMAALVAELARLNMNYTVADDGATVDIAW